MSRVLLVLLAAIVVAAPSDGREDRGNSVSTAMHLGLGETATGEIARHGLDPYGDVGYYRYYRLELSRRTDVTISARPGQGFEMDVIDAARCLVIATASEVEDGLGLRAVLEPGDHYVRLWAWNEAGMGRYEVSARETGPDDEGDMEPQVAATERGGTLAGAAGLAPGEIATGEITRSGVDHYRLEVPRRMAVMIDLSETSDPDIEWGVLNADRCLFSVYGHRHRRIVLDPGDYLRVWSSYEQDRARRYEVFVRELSADDHGNVEAEATAIELGIAVAGEIEPIDDEDYFRLRLVQPTRVVVTTKGAAHLGRMTNSHGEVIGEADWTRRGFRFPIRAELGAGVYFVRAASRPGDTGSYELVALEDVPDDHGNGMDSATAVSLGGEAEGMVDPRDDIDYFRLDVERRVIVVVSSTSEFDADLHLFDADGQRLDYGSGVIRTDLHIRRNLVPGRYYISVAAHDYYEAQWCDDPEAEDTGTYQLRIRERAPDDHGGKRETATDLHLGADGQGLAGSARGEIDPVYDRDVFRLEVRRRADLIVSVVADFSPDGTILDADGSCVAPCHEWVEEITLAPSCSRAVPVGLEHVAEEGELRLRGEVEPGTYFVQLWSKSRAGGGYEIVAREAGSIDD